MSRDMKCTKCGQEISTSFNRKLPILCENCGGEMQDIREFHPAPVKYDLMEWIVFAGSQQR